MNELVLAAAAPADTFKFVMSFSFPVTWILGLIPPLVVRFLLVRKPLTKPVAAGFVGVFWIVNFAVAVYLLRQAEMPYAVWSLRGLAAGAAALLAIASYGILAPGAEDVPFSVPRVWAIARNTFVEATRQKVFLIVLVVCLLILGSSRLFTQFTFEDQLKIIKDVGLAVITIGGALIAIILTAQLLASEVENRTIYTILSKPVWRLEFLLGKFIGMVILLLVSVLLMSAVFTFVLFYMEKVLINETLTGAGLAADKTGMATMQQVIEQIKVQVRDINLIKAVLLAFGKLVLLTAIAVFVASFSTSMIFTVFITACIYFMGHLQSTAREMWQGQGTLLANIGMILVALIPDLQSFNLADDIIVGNVITWTHAFKVNDYGLWMTMFVFLLAYAIFYYKEI